MTPAPDQSSDEHAPTRAAFDAWEKGAAPSTEDDVAFALPRPRSTFPPSFLLVLAAGCLVLTADSTADLEYELLGSSATVDLGKPGQYALDKARDGALVHIEGTLGFRRGTISVGGTSYEIAPLDDIPVLVRRTPNPYGNRSLDDLDQFQASSFNGEGRLIRLPDGPSSFLLRLVDSSERYATVRQQFQSIGQLPFGKPAWLLLAGDVPRASVWAIAWPIAVWIFAALLVWQAWRSKAANTKAKAERTQILREL